jgi:hypothetical protein
VAEPSWIADDLANSEAYQHGRTQVKLQAARAALERIALGKVRNMPAARAVAKLALELSAKDSNSREANPRCPAE